MDIKRKLRELLDDDAYSEERATRVLAGTVVLAVAGVVFFAIAPVGTGATYTEFYVLGPNDTAADYPENVSVGETVEMNLGVESQESQRLTYTLVVRTSEATLATRDIVLSPQETWTQSIPVEFSSPGTKRVVMELYIGTEPSGEPYRKLRLFVSVTPE